MIEFHPFPNLKTSRLYLWELKHSDKDEIFLLRTDDSVNAFIDREKAASIMDAKVFIDKIASIRENSKGIMWAITLKNHPQLIGTIGLWNVVDEKAEAEIGYEPLP